MLRRPQRLRPPELLFRLFKYGCYAAFYSEFYAFFSQYYAYYCPKI